MYLTIFCSVPCYKKPEEPLFMSYTYKIRNGTAHFGFTERSLLISETFIFCLLSLRRCMERNSSSTEGNTCFRLSLTLTVVLNMQNIYLRECWFGKEELKWSWSLSTWLNTISTQIEADLNTVKVKGPQFFMAEAALVELICGI